MKNIVMKNIVMQNTNKFQDVGVIKYIKSDNINTTIVSQDFGENKYSKNIRVTIQIK